MMHVDVRERDEPLESPKNTTSYKDEFLASLSHELRTPLQAILGYATALREAESNDETRRGLAVIERNARSLTQLVERLLDLSMLRSGQAEASFERLDVEELVRDSVSALEPVFGVRRIQVDVTAHGDTIAEVDPSYLRKAVEQLIFNGIRVSKPDSTLHIDVEGGEALAIRVTDHGNHWTPELIAEAFDLFAQNQYAERSSDGLGIGLAFVKSIAELHQGEAFAYLDPEGTGATFGIAMLRVTDRPKGEARVSAPQRPLHRLGVGSVLVVEDEDDARDLLRLILEREGLRVVTASAAHEALAHIATERFDYMVSDIGLPGMSGLDLIRTIRSGHLQPALRAVALTAFAGPVDGKRALDAGFDRFLPKPADAKSVVAAIQELAQPDAHVDVHGVDSASQPGSAR